MSVVRLNVESNRPAAISIGAPAGALIANPLKGSDVTPPAVTVTVRVPVAAVPVIVIVTGSDVPVGAPIVAVTPEPLNSTFVAPPRLLPVMVALTVAPCVPAAGVMPVIVGAAITLLI